MNFRKMRRFKQELTAQDISEILKRNTSGVLSVLGDDGYPYGVPLSYVYDGDHLYFHSATSGHKIDALTTCEKVSFCVIDQDLVVPSEFTSYFQSVIVFGRAHLLTNADEKREAIEKLSHRYSPEETNERMNSAIEKEWQAFCMIRLDIEHASGKRAIELQAK